MLHVKPLHTSNTRSSSNTMPLLNRPAYSKATLGDHSFSFASSVWISIPNDVRCAPSLSSFKSRLKTYLFRSAYKDCTLSLITVHMCMAWPCHIFVDDLSLKCINVCKKKKVKLINHDCLPILVLLYIMLYLMLACLMLFAALSNAACFYNGFFCIDFWKCFLFHALSWFIDTVCLFQVWFYIMRSAFNLFVFAKSMFTLFFIWKGYVLSGEIALNDNHYYY